MLLQGVPTVFDTDAVRPLIEVVEAVSGTRYGAGGGGDVALRVVADHARSISFLIADGVVPSNEDRGYVVRSAIRRAVTRGHQLGIERPFLRTLVERTIELLGDAYPELPTAAALVGDTVEREEHRFRQTLAAGSALLEGELAKGVVPGDVAFKLHDTFGFPIEITEEMATDAGVAVDRTGFDSAMAEQRARGKEARKGGSAEVVMETYRKLVDQHGVTDFTGREEHETKARVLGVFGRVGDELEVFLDRTPFYAESGGQVGDTGTITTATGRLNVLDTTLALPGLHRHFARLVEGEITPGQDAVATIDVERRQAIRRNHTGTHLLHWALREILGGHVKQQGSLVAPEYLRFDFSHHAATSPQELARVEDLANGEVLANDRVRHYETTKAQAAEVGAIAFFGDKYGDIVRVLEAGRHSVELCGGTHVGALGDIGPIRITSESSIGSNQRRIFATTGTTTLERVRRDRDALARAAALLAVAPDEVVGGLERLRDDLKEAREQLKAAQRAAAGAGAADLAADAVDGVVVARRDDLGRDELKDLAVALRQQPGVRAVVLGGAPATGGVALVAAVVAGSGLNASELLADAARTVGGGGGKAPDLAVAGGRHADRLDEALGQARAAATAVAAATA
jgi:alanyl-tRNA synthetase